ncbi:MAG: hypothetical protein LBK76_04510 [Verrucomicrobiales bacterium]|jgi:hypothetical protein|nr:hypothetical protein [Verrucomicrobiales bacterium]
MLFKEAIALLDKQGLLPTTLGSREIQEKLSARVRQLAVFSAKMDDAEYLQGVDEVTRGVASGGMSVSEAKARLGDILRARGFAAEEGDELTDHTSDRRRQLVIETRVGLVRGYAANVARQNPDRLWLFPCNELVRRRQSRAPRDWQERWLDAGGELYDGRMIAPVNDPVWTAISRFDQPYPPFDFNSGMALKPVRRKEAIALGVIDAGEEVEPADVPLPEFSANISGLAAALQADLAADPALQIVDGVLMLANDGTSEGAVKGWETRRAGGWTPKEQAVQHSRGLRAARRVLHEQRDAVSAMTHPEIGPIDFVYEGRNGTGLKHVIEKHGKADLLKIPGIIAGGKMVSRQGERIVLSKDDALVVLTKTEGKDRRHWVLTGYTPSASHQKAAAGLMNSRKVVIPSNLHTDSLRSSRLSAGAPAAGINIAQTKARLKTILLALKVRARARQLKAEGLLS